MQNFIHKIHRHASSLLLTPHFMMSNGIKTFIFFDIETTGLPQFENNKTRITELCAIAVQANQVELGVFPRVHNKLSLCFNPVKMIDPKASEMTGLYNDLLEEQSQFTSKTVHILNSWININQKPICFVAHNGNKFDFPILQSEVNKTGTLLDLDYFCVDTLPAFREIDMKEQEMEAEGEIITENTTKIENIEQMKQLKLKGKNEIIPFEFNDGLDELLCKAFDEYEKIMNSESEMQKVNETTPHKQIIRNEKAHLTSKRKMHQSLRTFKSYKLGDVYQRLTSKEPIKAHEAEADVEMLIMCAAIYGEKFVNYAKNNSRLLSEIPKMVPGKALGT